MCVLLKSGFDFSYMTRAFVDLNRFLKKDTRWDYGVERYQLLGSIDQGKFFVAYFYFVS